MGCFNNKGNFSRLPIKYGDRIVVIVGIRPLNFKQDDFAPGVSFTPISVPIRGEYNDYGGIENVDMTPGVKKLEEFFGIGIDEIVYCAERTTCGCEYQIENIEDIKKITDGLVIESGYKSYYPDLKVEISYVMEHEHIFDYLVSTANVKMKDHKFWTLPHKYIEALGYKKNITGNENGYDCITWTHDSLQTLKECCYVWPENEFGNYGKVSHTIGQLCSKIGCDVPELFDESYFETVFKNEIKTKSEHVFVKNTEFDYTFDKNYYHNGLFHQPEGIFMGSAILRSLGVDNEHLDIKYMKEVVEIASIINALRNLQMTWGVTNSYSQDINYDDRINFLQECLNVAEQKKNEWSDEDEDENEIN